VGSRKKFHSAEYFVTPAFVKTTFHCINLHCKNHFVQYKFTASAGNKEINIYHCVPTDPGEQATSLYEELKKLYPDHLAVHTAMLQCLELSEPKKQLPFIENVNISDNSVSAAASQIINIADTVISSVDQTQLLAYFGTKADHQPDAAKTKT
jgi:hypothetical protein